MKNIFYSLALAFLLLTLGEHYDNQQTSLEILIEVTNASFTAGWACHDQGRSLVECEARESQAMAKIRSEQ